MSPQSSSLTLMLVGSAAFFAVVMTQVFVFHSVPSFDDWEQIILVPLLAMALQYMLGNRFEDYIRGIISRKSRAVLVLFVLNWLLFFIPICVITVLVA
ncbi:MAG: hypothetical protein WC050_02375 [Candidatus Paceibacterota bacterium]